MFRHVQDIEYDDFTPKAGATIPAALPPGMLIDTAFISHFDYTPGIPTELADEFIRRINAATHSEPETRTKNVNGTKITTSKLTVDLEALDIDGPLDAETGALITSARKTPGNSVPAPGVGGVRGV